MGCLLGCGNLAKKCQLMDFWRKRQVCGATSARKVPTRGFSAKKEVVWHDLSASVAMVWLGSVLVQFHQFWQCLVPITEPATG